MTVSIFAHRLFFSYEDQDVLEDISFEVKEGEFIGIIGPNGGGKSTLLKLILGFLEPSSGALKVFGKDPATIRKQMAYVPQNCRFDRHFPISTLELVLMGRLSHLPFWGVYRREDVLKAEDALDAVGLKHLKNKSFGTLSGGQQQRVLIARAIVQEPKILLLDEPTANVDNQAEKDILNLLMELKGKMTILTVTHDLQTTIHRVDRVFCVQHTLIPYTPEEVCEHYALGLYHPPLLNLKSKGNGDD